VLVIGGCVFTCAHFVRKGARRMQEYSDVARKNPQMAMFELAAAVHPDIQIVSKDEDAGKITLRNKKTGEVVTLDLNELSSDKMGQAMERLARGMKPAARAVQTEEESEPEPVRPAPRSQVVETGPSAAQSSALAATVKKFPDFIATYRGAKTLDATINTVSGNVFGNYSFATSDAPETVTGFYEQKLTDAGFTILTKQSGSNANGSTAMLVAQLTDPQTSVTCEAEIDDSQTHVTVSFVRAGKR
jgi:hypothetical protein